MQALQTHHLVSTVRRTMAEWSIHHSSRILVGVSGGVDSMVLITVLKALGFDVTVAHVNFSLRGIESDDDALLVREWCALHDVFYLEKVMDTKKYSLENHQNIQSAARDLRYDWWESLVAIEKYAFVATAHHRDDVIESFFINLLRGTGIKGLTSIPARRGFYIRPLIRVSRKEIEQFASEFNVPFRLDRSNLSDDYMRNRIRHHLIPVIKELTNDSESIMDQTLHRIKTEWQGWQYSYDQWLIKNVAAKNGNFELMADEGESAFMLRWLEERGIPWQLAYDYVHSVSGSGKAIEYGNYRFSRTRKGFYFEKLEDFAPVRIETEGIYDINGYEFSIFKFPSSDFLVGTDPGEEFVDAMQIAWPLQIRKIEAGDHFYPLGMHGQSKKMQDMLVDLKLELHEKDQTKLLISDNNIVWLMGRRIDERFKVTPESQEVYKLTYRKKQ